MTASRTITIVVNADNHFDVHEGEHVCPRLTWDELLGQVALLTVPFTVQRKHLFRMYHIDDFIEWRLQHAMRMREHSANVHEPEFDEVETKSAQSTEPAL
jgi:hypothetical protein